MKIAVVGTGYVGLVSGACFAELGWHVTCIDKDRKKIAGLKKGNIPIFEPGLRTLVIGNMRAGRLEFSESLADAKGRDAVFIAVGTPTADGSRKADLSYVFAAAKELCRHLDDQVTVVVKSTVGTGERVKEIIHKTCPRLTFDMASNPEFLREGCAVQDFLKPDRVIVGVESERAARKMAALYQPLKKKGIPVLFTDVKTAEFTKYAANAFLATKIAFVNEMADICEKVGANIEDVATGMGLDHRIGADYMKPGPGYGGSCFPKDTRALDHVAEELGVPTRIVSTVIDTNEARKVAMVEKVAAACGSLKGKRIAVLGLAFKANTDDMRDSPALAVVPELARRGAKPAVFDPEAMQQAKPQLKQKSILWCASAEEALKGAEAAVIITEWEVFRKLDWKKARQAMKKPIVVDLRNILEPADMEKKGFYYLSIGRRPAGRKPKL